MNTSLLQRGLSLWNALTTALDGAQPLAALAARAYLAQVFFLSGLTKLRDWDTTLLLFTEEYRVPLLSPALAAALGTAGELVLLPHDLPLNLADIPQTEQLSARFGLGRLGKRERQRAGEFIAADPGQQVAGAHAREALAWRSPLASRHRAAPSCW